MSDRFEAFSTARVSRAAKITLPRAAMLSRVSAVALFTAAGLCATTAQAQTGPTNLVSVCSGVSLPRSVVTDTITPVVNGIVAPTQNTVNPILGVVGGALPLTPPLAIDAAGLLADAAAGQPITLQALNTSGLVVGPTDRCDAQADSFSLGTPAGVSIGGNSITGLGAAGQQASAGELGSVAIGNNAATDPSAVGALALGTGATVGPNATGSLALGPGASATGANSVALGAGSTATRGTAQAAGEVSVGAPGAERQITNVAAGTAPTDAANVGQVDAVAGQVAALNARAVQYDGAARDRVTLAGAGGTTLTNVAPGALTAASTDAVNGSQLYATNQAVGANTTAIANLSTSVANGAIGPVRYSDPATPTTPNGGRPTNDLTLVGAAAAPVALHNVADGRIGAGSTDAVNGGQVYALAQNAVNAVAYDTDAAGNRTNSVTLAGGTAGAPVRVGNVAAGSVAAGSTDAVNGGQLASTNAAVATAQTTAGTALALGQNAVQYDSGRTGVTLNPGGAAATVRNVAAGTSPTDAVNVGQLNSGLNSAVAQANGYTDARLAALNYDLRRVRRDAYAGTAGALAAAGMPQAYEAGRGMIAVGGGTYMDASAVAVGFSKAFNDGHTVVKLGGSYDSRGRTGASGGIGYQF